jgi:hypothetical protein
MSADRLLPAQQNAPQDGPAGAFALRGNLVDCAEKLSGLVG